VSKMIQTQRGATLVVALIMLVWLTLFAVSAMNTSIVNLKVVGNMQERSGALAATQQAIETVISTTQFVSDPNNAVINPCGAANTLCTDVTGDGVPEYTTVLDPKPSCIEGWVVPVSKLDMNDIEQLSCAKGVVQNFGALGSTSSPSLCADTTWDITAKTSSTSSATAVGVSQGVSIRVSADDLAAHCS